MAKGRLPRERLAFTGLTLRAGRYYRNGLGDVRGPLRQIGDTFLDEYGGCYRANGHQHSHHIESAGNLVSELEACGSCKGSGDVLAMTYGRGPDDETIEVECPDCKGTGAAIKGRAE